MVKGPHQEQLDAYVSGHNLAEIDHARQLWTKASKVLSDLSTHLENARDSVSTSMGGGKTGKAAAAAFHTVATSVKTQSADMSAAAKALDDAHDALQSAIKVKSGFTDIGSRPADATHKTTDQGHPDAFHNRQLQAGKDQKAWDGQYHDQETASAAAVKKMDTQYTASRATMEKIHGQTPSYGGGTSGGTGGPGGAWAPPGGGTGPTGPTIHHVKPPTFHPPHPGGGDPLPPHVPKPPHGDPPPYHQPPTVTDPVDPTNPVHHGPYDPGSHDPGSWPGDHPGSPQGPGGLTPGSTTGPALPTTPSMGPSSAGSLSSGTSSTMMGGLMSGSIIGGASGLSGAMRTSAMTGALTEEEILASRTGTAGATGAAGSAGGLGARGSATGATAGGRGAGGAGAGGRGGKGRKKRKPGQVDFFEDNEDWLDDDEASPGVLH